MKDRILFVSDFDNTISLKDFYWVVIEKYSPVEGRQEFAKWKQGGYTDFEFLSWVFGRIGQDEAHILKDILCVPIDPFFLTFVNALQSKQGDIAIVSAGNDYYIKRLLQHHGLERIPVFSNSGHFDNKAIVMSPPTNESFRSPRYGIDKAKVV